MWHLNRDCNLNCEYCYIRHLKQRERGHGVDIDIDAFKKNNIEWSSIALTGGEPFLYPNIVELCERLTDFTKIILVTNCSTSNIYSFADTIDPKKVISVNCSMHIGQRNDYQGIVEKVHYLTKKGFAVFTNQVMHPRIFEEYKCRFEMFKDNGILIAPKIFNGVYHLKEYPQGYTEKERREILKYAELAYPQNSEVNQYDSLFGRLDWKDRTCYAGADSIQIQYNGDAFRCEGDRRLLGNLYRGDIVLDKTPQICLQNKCCEYEGRMGHQFPDGYIRTKQNIKEIAKGYGATIVSRFRK